MIKLKNLLSEAKPITMYDAFYNYSKQGNSHDDYLGYINALKKKKVKIPSKYWKELTDSIDDIEKYENDPRQNDSNDMHDWDYDYTEAIDDFFHTLKEMQKKGILTGYELSK